jgi:hypothetical protein
MYTEPIVSKMLHDVKIMQAAVAKTFVSLLGTGTALSIL